MHSEFCRSVGLCLVVTGPSSNMNYSVRKVLFWAFLLFTSSLAHRLPVFSYFGRVDSNGDPMDVSRAEFKLQIKAVHNDTVDRDASLRAYPSRIANGEDVTVSWSGVKDANWCDFLALYCPPNGHVSSYLDYMFANESAAKFSEGHGSFKVVLFNMRTPCRFRYYRYDGRLYARLVAQSNVVEFVGGSAAPLQGHLALTGDPTQMRVMWNSGTVLTPFVLYGPSKSLGSITKGSSQTYHGDDMCGEPAEYFGFRNPGFLHDVLLDELKPSTMYYYQFGSTEGLSQVYNFTTVPLPDPSVAFKFLVYGDMGRSLNPGAHKTASLALKEVRNGAQLVLHIGDISYARGFAYIWDQWHAIIEPYATLVPYMVGIGNHEQDHTKGGSKDPSGAGGGFHPPWGDFGDDSGGECGVPMFHRFHMPENGNSLWWYSFDHGSVHFIMMSTEHNFTRGSRQYVWLEKDLSSVDRSRTPWIVFMGHRPMYISQKSFRQGSVIALHMQEEFEDLLYKYKVNLAFWGHYHSYERTCPVYKQHCTPAAPTHIVVGTAGFILEYYPWPIPEKEWSMYHAVHYGYGRVTVANSTAMLWEWVRNSDDEVADSVWLYQ